jgi:ATP-dependent RNA helicase RhlE
MQGFRSRRYDVLVATDIAARGIDVSSVSHVINFDVPNTPVAYTHRIGRTGRSERGGVARTFVTGEDRAWLRDTERMLGAAIPRLALHGIASESIDAPASQFRAAPDKRGRAGRSGGPRARAGRARRGRR